MAKSHHWTFKRRFRAKAYGWRGTAPASKRLKEAVSEIKKAARKEPVVAAEGTVAMREVGRLVAGGASPGDNLMLVALSTAMGRPPSPR